MKYSCVATHYRHSIRLYLPEGWSSNASSDNSWRVSAVVCSYDSGWHASFFSGIWFAIQRCSKVRVLEYVPSSRATNRCHYYSDHRDRDCTLGSWHPLALEKLLANQLRDNSDFEVFQRGFINIPGVATLNCSAWQHGCDLEWSESFTTGGAGITTHLSRREMTTNLWMLPQMQLLLLYVIFSPN